MSRIVRATMLAALIVACLAPSIATGASIDRPPALIEAPPQGEHYVAESYAEDRGVSLERARAILAEQEKGAGLVEELSERLGSSFGQVWFEDGRFIVYAVGAKAVDEARAVLADRKLAEQPVVHDVAWNAADLKAALKALGRDFADRVKRAEVRVSTTRGGLSVELAPGVDDAAAITADARATTAERQVPVTVERSEHPLPEADPAYGLPGLRSAGDPVIAGLWYQTPGAGMVCTLGFVTHAAGTYFLTAAHCLNGASGGQKQVCGVAWTCTTFGADVGGVLAGDLDAGVIASWGVFGTYPATLDWLNPWTTSAVFGASASVGGGYYCHTGVGSPSNGHSATTCGTNTGVTVVTYASLGVTLYLQTLYGANLCVFGGDSGGPVRSPANGHAIGIVSGMSDVLNRPNGGCGTYMEMYYSEAAHAARVLGVTVSSL